jgi:hypothetical protein
MLAVLGFVATLAYVVASVGSGSTAAIASVQAIEPGSVAKLEAAPVLGTEEEARAEPRETASAPTAQRSEVEIPNEELPRAQSAAEIHGRLVIRAIDASTLEPLYRFRARVGSEARIADRRSDAGSGEIRFALTPGTYSVVVLSNGFEPTELPPVRVVQDQTVQPDPVRLSAGSARISGSVTGDLPSDPALWAELVGEGRRPCVHCSAGSDSAGTGVQDSKAWMRENACPVCGFSARTSNLPVDRAGQFTFQDLAGGPYAIRLTDRHGQTVGTPQFVELHVAESLLVHMESAGSRTVRIELLDTDGTSLAKPWAARLGARQPVDDASSTERALVEFTEQRIEFQCVFRQGETCLARSSFSPPEVEPVARTWASAFGSRRLGVGARRVLDDRPRHHAEALWPEPSKPGIEPTTLSAVVDPDGLARIEGVPSLALILKVDCDPFEGEVPIPSALGVAAVRVQLKCKAHDPDGAKQVPQATTVGELEASRRN